MKLKLIKKQEEAKGTKSFFFKPENKIDWLPGQFYYFTLPKLNYPDSKGSTRHFTISSSPTEGNLMRFTTRMRDSSGYKATLDELPIGSQIDGEGPSGTFIIDENEPGPNVLLAGGIGITPFRTIIRYILDKKLKIPLYLIYSDSTNEDAAFKKELETWAKKNQNIKMELVITSKDGRIDEAKIAKFIENWDLAFEDCIFWVSGPPAMVEAMEPVLGKLNISAGQVRSEKFTGY